MTFRPFSLKYSARNAFDTDSPTGGNCAGSPTKITLPPKLGRTNVRRSSIRLSVPNINNSCSILREQTIDASSTIATILPPFSELLIEKTNLNSDSAIFLTFLGSTCALE